MEQQGIEALKTAIEQALWHEMKTPKDFDHLSEDICKHHKSPLGL